MQSFGLPEEKSHEALTAVVSAGRVFAEVGMLLALRTRDWSPFRAGRLWPRWSKFLFLMKL